MRNILLIILAVLLNLAVLPATASIVNKWGPVNPHWNLSVVNVRVSILHHQTVGDAVVFVQNNVLLDTTPIRFSEFATFDSHTGELLCRKSFDVDSGSVSSGPVVMTGGGGDETSVTMWNVHTCASVSPVKCLQGHGLFAANDEFVLCMSSFDPSPASSDIALTAGFTNLSSAFSTVQVTRMSSLLGLWMMMRTQTAVVLGRIRLPSNPTAVLCFAGLDIRQLYASATSADPISSIAPQWAVPLAHTPSYQRVYETPSGGLALYHTHGMGLVELICVGPKGDHKSFSSSQECLITQVEGDTFVCVFNNFYALVVDLELCKQRYVTQVGETSDGRVEEVNGLSNYNDPQLVFLQEIARTQHRTGFVIMKTGSPVGADFVRVPGAGHHELGTTPDFVLVAGNSSVTVYDASGDVSSSWSADELGDPEAVEGDSILNRGAVVDRGGNVFGFEIAFSSSKTASILGIRVPTLKLCSNSAPTLNSNEVTLDVTANLVVITVSYPTSYGQRFRQTGLEGQLQLFGFSSTPGLLCLDSGSWERFASSLSRVLPLHEFSELCFEVDPSDPSLPNWSVAQLRSKTSTGLTVTVLNTHCSGESNCGFNQITDLPSVLQTYKPFGSSSFMELGMRTVLLSPSRGAWLRSSWPIGECLDIRALGDFTPEHELGPSTFQQVYSACSAASCAVASCEAAVSVAFQLYWCFLSFGVAPSLNTVVNYLAETAPWIVFNNDRCTPALMAMSGFLNSSKVRFVSKQTNGSVATFLTNCHGLSVSNVSQSTIHPFEGEIALVGWAQNSSLVEQALTESGGLELELSPCIVWGSGDLIALPYSVIFIGIIVGVVSTVVLNTILRRTSVRHCIIWARVKMVSLVFPAEFGRGHFYKLQSVAEARQRFHDELRYFYTARIPKSRAFFQGCFDAIWRGLVKRRGAANPLTVAEKFLCDEFFWNSFTLRGTRISTTDKAKKTKERTNFDRTVDVFEELVDQYNLFLEDPCELNAEPLARLGISEKKIRLIQAMAEAEVGSLSNQSVISTGAGAVIEDQSERWNTTTFANTLNTVSSSSDVDSPVVGYGGTFPTESDEPLELEGFENHLVEPPPSVRNTAVRFSVDLDSKGFDDLGGIEGKLLTEDFLATGLEKALDKVDFHGSIFLKHDKENAILFSSEGWVLSIRFLVVLGYVLYIVATVPDHCQQCSHFEKYQAVYFRIVNSGLTTGYLLATYLRLLVLRWSRLSIIFALGATILFSPAAITHFIPGYFKYALVTIPLTLVLGCLVYLFHQVTELPSLPTYRCQHLFSGRFAQCFLFVAFDKAQEKKDHRRESGSLVGKNDDARTRDALRFLFKAALRIFITFVGTVIMQMSFNYALLTVYGSGVGYFDAVDFDYSSRHVACSMYSLHIWGNYAANKLQVLATLFG